MRSYRRLLDMFGDVVLGIDHALFEKEIRAVKVRGAALCRTEQCSVV